MTHPPAPATGGRSLPSFGFLLALLALGGLALGTLATPARIITGLPEDPPFERVRAELWNRLRVETGELRLQAALLGDRGEADSALAAASRASVLAAIGRGPGDPRALATLAFVDLVARRLKDAERSYREAIGRAPTYGEARLGLGVTLALRAAAEDDDERARGLRLRAISQLASVPTGDPCYAVALYDRARLLVRVGRADEARHWADAYLARDPGSAWSGALGRALPGAHR